MPQILKARILHCRLNVERSAFTGRGEDQIAATTVLSRSAQQHLDVEDSVGEDLGLTQIPPNQVNI